MRISIIRMGTDALEVKPRWKWEEDEEEERGEEEEGDGGGREGH